MLKFLICTFGLLWAGSIPVLADAGAGGDASDADYRLWVSEATRGGLATPPGVSCSGWQALGGQSVGGVGIMELDNVIYDLYGRSCVGVLQNVWVPRLAAVDVAAAAYDEVRRTVGTPLVQFSPPQPAGGVVGFPTWLGVQPMADVTGTATIPGLSATATARVVGIEWRTGARLGDSALVTCAPWGSLERPDCAWTPRYPSVGRVTGTSDELHHGSVTLVWDVTWAASDGSSGAFEQLRTTTDYTYRVSEVQAIGEHGG